MSGEQILRIFMIRRWWIIACVIIGALVGTALAFALPRVYDAKSQVIVSVAEDSDVSAAESAMYIEDRMPTLLAVGRSVDFATEVAESPGVDRSAADVRSELDATVVPETSVIEIAARDKDPEQARILADRAAETMAKSFVTERLGADNGMDVSVLQKAESDGAAVFPDPLRFLGLGALAGLLLGLLVAPIRHGLDSRVRDDADIKRILDAELLAVRMRRPGRGIRREIVSGGAATSISGLLARLGLIGRSRGTVTMTLCGIGGVGNELAADIVETAAASGMKCALVSADPKALNTAHYRELSQVTGISVVDVSSGGEVLTVRGLRAALATPVEHFDLIVCLSTDLASHPETCAFLDLSDLALVVSAQRPERADLRATQELLRASDLRPAGVVLVDAAERTGTPTSAASTDQTISTGHSVTAAAPAAESDDLVTTPASDAEQEPEPSALRLGRSQSTEGEQS